MTLTHTRAVQLLKVSLPAMAMLWFVMVLVVGHYATKKTYFRLSPSQSAQLQQDATVLQMVNPRFLGLDENARPFQVQANTATQGDRNIQNVQLQGLKATVYSDKDTATTIEAPNGHLDGKQNAIGLDGLVKFADTAGHQFLGSNIMIDTLGRTALSGKPIAGSSPFGSVRASGLRVINGGETIIFEGPAKLEIPDK